MTVVNIIEPVLDKKGRPILNEALRIEALRPYLRRSAELHRVEYMKLLEKILPASLPLLAQMLDREERTETRQEMTKGA